MSTSLSIAARVLRQQKSAKLTQCTRAKSGFVPTAALKSRERVEEELNSQVSATARSGQRDVLDLTFTDTRAAYKSKTNYELLRALIVLKLTSYDFLTRNHTKVRISARNCKQKTSPT